MTITTLNKNIKSKLSEGFKEITYQKEPFIVFNAIILVEGLFNGDFFSEDILQKLHPTFEGLLVYNDHPSKEKHEKYSKDNRASRDKEDVEALQIGFLFNVKFNKGSEDEKSTVSGEVYINVRLAEQTGFTPMLEEMKSGTIASISVGGVLKKDERSNVTDIKPDHLAILPKGKAPACSPEDGCKCGSFVSVASDDGQVRYYESLRSEDGYQNTLKEIGDLLNQKFSERFVYALVRDYIDGKAIFETNDNQMYCIPYDKDSKAFTGDLKKVRYIETYEIVDDLFDGLKKNDEANTFFIKNDDETSMMELSKKDVTGDKDAKEKDNMPDDELKKILEGVTNALNKSNATNTAMVSYFEKKLADEERDLESLRVQASKVCYFSQKTLEKLDRPALQEIIDNSKKDAKPLPDVEAKGEEPNETVYTLGGI